jgi:hypothetical protein
MSGGMLDWKETEELPDAIKLLDLLYKADVQSPIPNEVKGL